MGRPGKDRISHTEIIASMIEEGIPLQQALLATKLSSSAFYAWMDEDEALEARIEEARAVWGIKKARNEARFQAQKKKRREAKRVKRQARYEKERLIRQGRWFTQEQIEERARKRDEAARAITSSDPAPGPESL